MTPKIKIHGAIRVGSPVYIYHGGKAVTTNKREASKDFPHAIGKIIKGPALKLNGVAEQALKC